MKKTTAGIWISGIIATGSLWGLQAQVQELPENFPVLVENAPDSSAGFEQLLKRMPALPDGAQPVTVVIRGGTWENNRHQLVIPNHWISNREEEMLRLITNSTNKQGSIRIIKGSDNGGFNINFNPDEVDYVVQKVEVEKNLREIFDLLVSTDKKNEWEKKRFENRFGELMLYAARLHEMGYSDPANQLAAWLFEKHSKRGTLLRALSTLADLTYIDLLVSYEEDKDTGKFVAAVKETLVDNRAYWVLAPAMQEKVSEWEHSLSLAADALPEGAGAKIDESQKTLYVKLLAAPESLATLAAMLEDNNWLLQPNALLDELGGYYGREEKSELVEEGLSVLKKSRTGFMNLAEVMLMDGRLLPHSNEYGPETVEYNDHDDIPTFPQPMTVKNLAAAMLSGLAPADEDWDSEEPEEMLMLLQNFKALTAEMDRIQLAKYYLDRRDEYNLPVEAVYTLLSSDDSATRKEAIGVMLQEEDFMDEALPILLDFHDYHKEEAEAGLAKVLVYMKTINPEEAWGFGGAEGLKANISKIEKLLGHEPEVAEATPEFGDALDEWIAAGNPDNVQGIQTVLKSGQAKSQAAVQQILADRIQSQPLEIARVLLSLQDMMVRSGGLGELQSMMYSQDQDMMRYYVHPDGADETAGENEIPQAALSDLHWEKEVWLPLLQAPETEEQKKKAFMIAFSIVNPIQDMSEHTGNFYSFSHLLGGKDNQADQLLLTWAKRFLENPEDLSWLEEVPTADNLSEERLQEIRAILTGEDIRAAQAVLNSENLNEVLAANAMSETDETVAANLKLWQARQDAQNKITLINPVHGKEDPVLKGIEPGQPLSFETVNDILSRAKAEAEKGENGFLVIRTAMYHQGASLQHNRGFISSGFFSEPGLRIYGITRENRVSGQFSLDTDLQLKMPAAGEKKELNILELIEAGQDQQLESLSAAIHEWLTTPVPPHQSGGQLTIIYSGKNAEEEAD